MYFCDCDYVKDNREDFAAPNGVPVSEFQLSPVSRMKVYAANLTRSARSS